MQTMLTKWTSHLRNDPKAKEDFEKSIRGSKYILDRVKDILTEDLDAQERAEEDIRLYDNPSWSHKQAYMNGYRKGLKVAIAVVDLDNQIMKESK